MGFVSKNVQSFGQNNPRHGDQDSDVNHRNVVTDKGFFMIVTRACICKAS